MKHKDYGLDINCLKFFVHLYKTEQKIIIVYINTKESVLIAYNRYKNNALIGDFTHFMLTSYTIVNMKLWNCWSIVHDIQKVCSTSTFRKCPQYIRSISAICRLAWVDPHLPPLKKLTPTQIPQRGLIRPGSSTSGREIISWHLRVALAAAQWRWPSYFGCCPRFERGRPYCRFHHQQSVLFDGAASGALAPRFTLRYLLTPFTR